MLNAFDEREIQQSQDQQQVVNGRGKGGV